MSYHFNFDSLPLHVVHGRTGREQTKRVDKDDKEQIYEETDEQQWHTHTYIKRVADTLPENCTAIYHTEDGDWLELDVGPESRVGQREFPQIKIKSIEKKI